jgi:hypothetical protein
METNPINVEYKKCSNCNLDKEIINFYTHRNKKVCKQCFNERRRNKYLTDEKYREKKKQDSIKTKQNKKQQRDLIKEQHQQEIGIDNKVCKYCKEIKLKTKFRKNRLKCKDCERDDPKEKFKRYVRTRIYNSLKRNKTKHTVEYLGCSSEDYYKWIMNYNSLYTSQNYGPEWHIDHVIPLSTFNLENSEQQLLAFNWRNTMPLSSIENMQKNNRINMIQISEHYNKLIKFNEENNLTMPQEFIDLFSNAFKLRETTLEPLLPPIIGNINGELG